MSSNLFSRLRKSTNVRLMKYQLQIKRWGIQAAERLSPGLTGQWASELFTTPRRHQRPARETALIKQAKAFPIETGYGQLAAWSWGQGPTILLAHGWEGRGAQLGDFVAPLVAAGYRVVTFDGPGHGESPGQRSSLVVMARALRAVGEKLGRLEAIIAHSMGAAATSLAIRAGLAVDRLVYIAPPAAAVTYVRRFGNFLGLSSSVQAQLEARIEALYGIKWQQLNVPTLAPQMTLPLLVVHDIGDRDVPWREGEELVQAWPQALLYSTSGLGHRRILHTDDVIKRSAAFIIAGDINAEITMTKTIEPPYCATPGCHNPIAETWDRLGHLCSNCVTEQELYNPQVRWQVSSINSEPISR